MAPTVNRIWAGDLTAIPTRAGWLYLAVVLDLYSRRVIGWAMSANPDQHVALQALHMALDHRRPKPGLIHHSDQGALYTSVAYQRLLAQRGPIASMSRKGNCFDNAAVESFFSTLKNELVHDQRFHTREDAQAAVFEFIGCSTTASACIRRCATSVPCSLRRGVYLNSVSMKSGVAQEPFTDLMAED